MTEDDLNPGCFYLFTFYAEKPGVYHLLCRFDWISTGRAFFTSILAEKHLSSSIVWNIGTVMKKVQEGIIREVPVDELPCYMHWPWKYRLFNEIFQGAVP